MDKLQGSGEKLLGLEIVITRPYAQAEPWAQRLQELGAKTYIIPLLEIIPVAEPEQIRAIQNCILDFDLYSKAIFVSQNAVQHAFEWIENYWPQLPVGVDFFAVGEATAQQIVAQGARVTDLAQTQTGAMTSETLLQSPGLQNVAGEKIIIFRGVGGRPHLGETLKARGALVDYCELYERRLPTQAVEQLALIMQEIVANKNCVVVLHSGEALENLQQVLPQVAQQELPMENELKKKIVLLVPSERILELAKNAGFTQIYSAQNATDISMLQGLMDLKRNLTVC
jgi:uroporphyrinogen-III synthase